MGVVPDRVGVTALTSISSRLWDLRANLMEDIVEQHGTVRSVAWFARNMPRYERILVRFGPIRTHLVTTALSLVNRCGYCSYGHAHAFQLHHFQRSGEVFPLSEQDLLDRIGSDRNTILADVGAALDQAGLADEIPWLDRTFELLDGTGEPDGQADEDLLHLAAMFDWLNACGIAAETEPDGAHEPINKDTELRARYAAARASSGSGA